MKSGPSFTTKCKDHTAEARASVSQQTGPTSARIVVLIFAIGIGLRLIHCFGNVEMWSDELAVVRNVQNQKLTELVSQPLDHKQVAPIGFLAYLKISSDLFGYSDIGVRVGPTLLGILNLLLFWRVLGRFTDGLALYAPLMLFAISPAMVIYGGSPKQYVCDVTVCLLLILLSLRYLEQPDNLRRGLVAGIVGGFAMLASFPAVPTASILGVILVVNWWRNRATIRPLPLLCQGTCWLVGIAAAGFVAKSLIDPTTDDFMRDFWANDFPPLSSPLAPVIWSLTKIYGNYGHSLLYASPFFPPLIPIAGLPVVLAVVGLVFSWRQRNWRPYLFLVPMVAGLASAFIHLLPFEQRVGVYAGWPILILAGIGLVSLRQSLTGKLRYTANVLAVLMVMPMLLLMLILFRPPYHQNFHSIDVLMELADRLQDADRIYVYTQGRHSMAFYGQREGIQQWMQGERHYDDPRGYLREVDLLRGEPRVWFYWVRMREDEPGLIRRYLETIGTELEQIPNDDWPSGAVLYDLSDQSKLEAASADTFPLGDL